MARDITIKDDGDWHVCLLRDLEHPQVREPICNAISAPLVTALATKLSRALAEMFSSAIRDAFPLVVIFCTLVYIWVQTARLLCSTSRFDTAVTKGNHIWYAPSAFDIWCETVFSIVNITFFVLLVSDHHFYRHRMLSPWCIFQLRDGRNHLRKVRYRWIIPPWSLHRPTALTYLL